jgi:WD40 repeat protein
MVATNRRDTNVRILDTESGKELYKLDKEGGIFVTFSPDGKKLITHNGLGSDTRIWDADTGKEWQWLKGRVGTIHSADFSSDGKKLVTVSKEDNAVRIWTLE